MSNLPLAEDLTVKWRADNLNDMPQRVMQQIVGVTDHLSLENVRECSAWMQDCVDELIGYNEKLSISLCSNKVEIQLNPTNYDQGDFTITIYRKEHGYTIIHPNSPPKNVDEGNYLAAGAQEFCKIFKYPKNHVKEVHMEFAPWRQGNRLDDSSLVPFVQTLQESVKNRNDLLSAEQLNLNFEKNENCVGALVPIFKPKVLKSLFIQTENTFSASIPVETLMFLDQWRHLEKLMIRGWPLEDVRFEWFMRIPDLWLEVETLTVEFTKLALEKFRLGSASKYTVYFAQRGNGVAEYLNGTCELEKLEKRNTWSAISLTGQFRVELKEDRLLLFPEIVAPIRGSILDVETIELSNSEHLI